MPPDFDFLEFLRNLTRLPGGQLPSEAAPVLQEPGNLVRDLFELGGVGGDLIQNVQNPQKPLLTNPMGPVADWGTRLLIEGLADTPRSLADSSYKIVQGQDQGPMDYVNVVANLLQVLPVGKMAGGVAKAAEKVIPELGALTNLGDAAPAVSNLVENKKMQLPYDFTQEAPKPQDWAPWGPTVMDTPSDISATLNDLNQYKAQLEEALLYGEFPVDASGWIPFLGNELKTARDKIGRATDKLAEINNPYKADLGESFDVKSPREYWYEDFNDPIDEVDQLANNVTAGELGVPSPAGWATANADAPLAPKNWAKWNRRAPEAPETDVPHNLSGGTHPLDQLDSSRTRWQDYIVEKQRDLKSLRSQRDKLLAGKGAPSEMYEINDVNSWVQDAEDRIAQTKDELAATLGARPVMAALGEPVVDLRQTARTLDDMLLNLPGRRGLSGTAPDVFTGPSKPIDNETAWDIYNRIANRTGDMDQARFDVDRLNSDLLSTVIRDDSPGHMWQSKWAVPDTKAALEGAVRSYKNTDLPWNAEKVVQEIGSEPIFDYGKVINPGEKSLQHLERIRRAPLSSRSGYAGAEHPWVQRVRETWGVPDDTNGMPLKYLAPDGTGLTTPMNYHDQVKDLIDRDYTVGNDSWASAADIFGNETGAIRVWQWGDDLMLETGRPLTTQQLDSIERLAQTKRTVTLDLRDPTNSNRMDTVRVDTRKSSPAEWRQQLQDASNRITPDMLRRSNADVTLNIDNLYPQQSDEWLPKAEVSPASPPAPPPDPWAVVKEAIAKKQETDRLRQLMYAHEGGEIDPKLMAALGGGAGLALLLQQLLGLQLPNGDSARPSPLP